MFACRKYGQSTDLYSQQTCPCAVRDSRRRPVASWYTVYVARPCPIPPVVSRQGFRYRHFVVYSCTCRQSCTCLLDCREVGSRLRSPLTIVCRCLTQLVLHRRCFLALVLVLCSTSLAVGGRLPARVGTPGLQSHRLSAAATPAAPIDDSPTGTLPTFDQVSPSRRVSTVLLLLLYMMTLAPTAWDSVVPAL